MGSSNIQLTDEQKEILNNCLNDLYISSAPGSGKSTMLSLICGKLLQTPTNRVMLVTFTNKAAKSIKSKCSSSDQNRIIGGTFHSIAYRLMKQNGMNVTICDENKKRVIIKKLFGCRKEKDKFECIYERISIAKSKFPMQITDEVSIYNEELRRYSLVDFDDIIYTFLDSSKDDQGSGSRLGIPSITHCLVDELQDTSGPQLEMLREIRRRTACTMVGVADDDQCHPSGNRILTTDGYINIEELDPKFHKVPAYDGHGKLYGLKNPNGYSIEKSVRKYTGDIILINAGNSAFTCTPNHKCYIQWNTSNTKNTYVLYLMKKNNKYRLGQCKLFCGKGFHLGTRARLEGADCCWIIQTYNNKQDALKYESILSIKYQIPTITFNETIQSIHFKQEIINSIFNELQELNLKEKANTLLLDFKKDIRFPIWKKQDYTKQGARTFFITQACNIVPHLMNVGFFNETRYLEKKVITSISTVKVYDINVYSLNVNKFHNYICNNILVGNSIYAWRGARPENVRDFISEFKCTTLNMGTNFRSKSRIVERSRNLIECNVDRLPKQIRANTSEKGLVKAYKCANPFDEIDYVKELLERNEGTPTSILYRNRTFKNHLEFQLRKAGIRYRVNDFLDITDRSAVRVMIACLKIASGDFDVFDLEQASKALKGIGSVTLKKIQEEAVDGDVAALVAEWKRDEKLYKKVMSITKLQKCFREYPNAALDILVRYAEKLFIKSFDYQDDMKLFLLEVTRDFHINSADIKELANELGLSGQADGEGNDEDALVELSTVHGYKGLEQDIVILPFCQTYLESKPGRKIVIEEERRLFYVAATRAKDKLYMCYSGAKPRFIEEMGV